MCHLPLNKPFLTVQELAIYTGIPERTLRHHIEKGALVARVIGLRRRYIPLEEAIRYVGDDTLTATPPGNF